MLKVICTVILVGHRDCMSRIISYDNRDNRIRSVDGLYFGKVLEQIVVLFEIKVNCLLLLGHCAEKFAFEFVSSHFFEFIDVMNMIQNRIIGAFDLAFPLTYVFVIFGIF